MAVVGRVAVVYLVCGGRDDGVGLGEEMRLRGRRRRRRRRAKGAEALRCHGREGAEALRPPRLCQRAGVKEDELVGDGDRLGPTSSTSCGLRAAVSSNLERHGNAGQWLSTTPVTSTRSTGQWGHADPPSQAAQPRVDERWD